MEGHGCSKANSLTVSILLCQALSALRKPEWECKYELVCFINIVLKLPTANNHAPEVTYLEKPQGDLKDTIDSKVQGKIKVTTCFRQVKNLT